MSSLISQSGLWKRITTNLKEYDQYEPIQDTPQFINTNQADTRIAITIDSKLYDTRNYKYLEVESDNEFKSVVYSNIARYVTADVLIHLFYALKNNGDLYSGFLDNESKVSDWTLVQSGVDHLMKSLRSKIVSVTGSRLYYHDHGIIGTSDNLPNDDEIIQVQYGLVITHGWIFIIDDSTVTFNSIERQGRLIGCGIVHICQDRISVIEVAIIEEVDGELITRCWLINRGEVRVSSCREVYNRDLVESHHQSPWVDVIAINCSAHLVNRDGVVVKLLSECGTTSTNIPRCIFNINHYSKNPLSRIVP